MDTYSPDSSSPWRSTRYPPPSKPLPPLPNTKFLTVPKPLSNEPLLCHPVPSPSLRFDVMTLPSQPTSYASSPQSSTFSSASTRDSASSIVEFAESLLPPLPTRVRAVNTKDTVDCRLQEQPRPLHGHISNFPEAKQAVPLDNLYASRSGSGKTKTRRRDSAMFDITLVDRSNVRPYRVETRVHYDDPSIQKTLGTNETSEPGVSTGVSRQNPPSVPPSTFSVPVQAETSFIDWDDEIPRLARMKKSIADLKNGGRVRANSAPMTPPKSPNLSSNSAMTAPTEAGLIKTGHRLYQTQTHPIQPYKFHTFPKRKNTRYRRSIFLVENTTRAARPDYQRADSALSTTSMMTTRQNRVSTTSSIQNNHCRGGLGKLTSWVKRLVHCS